MSHNGPRCRLVILGVSSVLRLTHRKTKIPVELIKILEAAVKAYWENGSFQGFLKLMDDQVGKLMETAAFTEPLLTDEPNNSSDYNAFMAALYQEVFAFFEFAQLRTTLYLAHVSRSSESLNVIFTLEPCTATMKDVGPGRSELVLTPIRKEEDE